MAKNGPLSLSLSLLYDYHLTFYLKCTQAHPHRKTTSADLQQIMENWLISNGLWTYKICRKIELYRYVASWKRHLKHSNGRVEGLADGKFE